MKSGESSDILEMVDRCAMMSIDWGELKQVVLLPSLSLTPVGQAQVYPAMNYVGLIFIFGNVVKLKDLIILYLGKHALLLSPSLLNIRRHVGQMEAFL